MTVVITPGEAGGARPVTVSVVVNVTGGGWGPRTVSLVTTVDGGWAGRVLVKVGVTVQVIVTGGGGGFDGFCAGHGAWWQRMILGNGFGRCARDGMRLRWRIWSVRRRRLCCR